MPVVSFLARREDSSLGLLAVLVEVFTSLSLIPDFERTDSYSQFLMSASVFPFFSATLSLSLTVWRNRISPVFFSFLECHWSFFMEAELPK